MKRSLWLLTVFAMILAIFVTPTVLGTEEVFDNNLAPIAENLEFKTYKNVAITGTVSAMDPDGGNILYYISESVKKGTLEFDLTGNFVYTPNDGAKGKDSFTYYAVDNGGAVSNKAKVTIKIEKQKTDVWYSDLEDRTYHYSALVLAENGIYVGESLGNKYFFNPDEPVTKGRFLAMCMQLCGAEAINGVAKTGYSDDDTIPMWVKPYAAAALMTGVLDASQKELKSEEPITTGAAAVILDGAMNITDVYMDNNDNTAQAFANLSACKIVTKDAVSLANDKLTMGQAAEMLAGAFEILENRR